MFGEQCSKSTEKIVVKSYKFCGTRYGFKMSMNNKLHTFLEISRAIYLQNVSNKHLHSKLSWP